MSVCYEWCVEELEGTEAACTEDTEIIENRWRFSASEMLLNLRTFPADGVTTHTRLVVVRDKWNGQELECRSWAYLKKDKAGNYYLPTYFLDALDNIVCKVPEKLHKELAKAQKLN